MDSIDIEDRNYTFAQNSNGDLDEDIYKKFLNISGYY